MESIDAMQITTSRIQGRVPVSVLHLKGRLNMGTAEQLEGQARQVMAAGPRDLLLDLSELLSLTSAGLRSIHTIAKALDADQAQKPAAKSPHLKLLNPPPAIERVLDIAGFSQFLEIHRDLQTAVASFG